LKAFWLCLHGVGGQYSAHPDYLLKILTAKQIDEWDRYLSLFADPVSQLVSFVGSFLTKGTVEPNELNPIGKKRPPTYDEIKSVLRQIRGDDSKP